MITKVTPANRIHSAGRSGFKVPAGIYWIGDPCYMIKGKDWDLLVNNDKNNGSIGGIIDGHIIVALTTVLGDGEYSDSRGFKYKVDSGYIGIIPIDYLHMVSDDSQSFMRKDGRVIEFARTTDVYVTDRGIMHFGKAVIETGHENSETDSIEDFTHEPSFFKNIA